MEKKYKLLRHLTSDKAILENSSELFLASFSDVLFSGGPEVLVFPCDAYGKVTDWSEVDGGRGYKSLQAFLDIYSTPTTFVTL